MRVFRTAVASSCQDIPFFDFLWLALLLAGAHMVAAQPSATPQGATLIQQYCYDCHGEGMRRGGIDLEDMLLPDRAQITMTVPFMRAYTELLVRTCHRRGAHAMGGMAAFIPTRHDPAANELALGKVKDDKGDDPLP